MNSPETTLWQSVIIQAVRDAAWTPAEHIPTADGEMSVDAERSRRERDKERREADAWFRRAGKYFRKVCSDAGFDPGFIHEAYVSGRIDIAQLRASEETKRARRAA